MQISGKNYAPSVSQLKKRMLFVHCTKTKHWKEVRSWLGNAINLPDLNPQNALLGFQESHLERYSILASHMFLIFKKSLYDCRKKDIVPSFYYVRAKTAQTEKMKNAISILLSGI